MSRSAPRRLALALFAAMSAAAPSGATVIYAVTLANDAGGFVWAAPGFVERSLEVPARQLQSCWLSPEAGRERRCQQVDFLPDDTLELGAGTEFRVDGIRWFSNASGPRLRFADRAFRQPGPHDSIFNQYGSKAILTVTRTDVPEPAAWALLLLGLGLVGAALRRFRQPESLLQ